MTANDSRGNVKISPIAAALAFDMNVMAAGISEFGFDAPDMGSGLPPNWLQPIECGHAPGKSKGDFKAFATYQAALYGLPPVLAHAVMEIESGFDAVQGRMAKSVSCNSCRQQLECSVTRAPFEELGDPATNISLGTKYLAEASKLARNDVCSTLMKYRVGHSETRFSVLSLRYCERARAGGERPLAGCNLRL